MSEPQPPSKPETSGYAVYADFIEKVLDAQEARKTSTEQRGVAVITTAGTLVTLLFAVIGLATRRTQTYSLPGMTKNWLIAAVVLLVLAAVCGLATNAPLRYKNVKANDLRRAVDNMWNEDAWSAAGRITRSRIDILERAARMNSVKVWLLFVAVLLEASALVPLAVVVIQIAR